jgi:hypothetical protein
MMNDCASFLITNPPLNISYIPINNKHETGGKPVGARSFVMVAIMKAISSRKRRAHQPELIEMTEII